MRVRSARALGVVVLASVLAGPSLAASPAPGIPAVPLTGSLARYRDAHLALTAGEYARAQSLFEGLPDGFVLVDYAAYYAAESLVRAGADQAAFERFRALPERFPDSVLGPAAILAAGDAALRLGRWPDAEREWRRFLAKAPTHPETGRVLVRLAEARAAAGQPAEAVLDLRRRWIEAPASGWGEAAREIMDDLARLYGLTIAPLTVEEGLTQAQRLADAGEASAAIRAFESLLAQATEPGVRHRILVRLAPILGRSPRGPEAVPLLQAALAEPPTPARPQLLAELGRLLARTGQQAAAVPVLEQLLTESPESPLAPDAALNLARARLELRQPEAARATLQRLLAAYPDSGAAPSARWELAWIEYRAGRLRDAALAFRQLSAMGTPARLGGLYWAGRSLDAAGEKTAAAALYREIQGVGPNTYYGLLAARRGPGRAAPSVAPAVQLVSNPLALLAPEPHYRKAEALASAGFDIQGLAELEALGAASFSDPDRAWGLAIAFAQFGEPGRSLRALRRAFGGAADGGAPGLTARFWQLYYPLGYADTVWDQAQRAGLDPYFVAAVIREESSYDPRARSWVGAVGLMQLMPDTARLVAREAGLVYDEPASLWDPGLNIALGTRYIATLRGRFQEPLLAVASYNAGPHRVQRWLADRPTADVEEFVDQIPFDETRGFVKRVFTSWQQYRRHYGTLGPPSRKG
jgi:soluble lytic murein transglycosylase